ncbi:TonB-dependent receptor [Aestuariicella hydrocarbonica]|uniref:TonB-dependent receptor n=1 Tax=Pseudomaricurvus hydrocarbonicus TaxID=1470433 RepID=A0A9E5MLY7_9GAMM|nr:TonB-dependent receptor [Aestuariicella hydrocarbonica]NHO65813.1 TonB-dependent receptor [Aestuariicella hydrocarbonica]
MNRDKKLKSARLAKAFLPVPLALAMSQPTFAQDKSFMLEEIIVTAQRKAEGLQNAAIAIDVATGEDMIDAGITDMSRLGELSPALSVQSTANGNLVFIRGVGNFTLTPNSDSASAFNYDGVYMARPTSSTGVFYDLERVEILKGPQGTLYGRNATGGAINVIPAQPRLGETSGYITASYGTLEDVDSNSFTTEGAVNIPLGENTAARISASVVNSDPTFKDGTGEEDTRAFRFQVLTEPSEKLIIRFSADYAANDDTGAGITYAGKVEYDQVSENVFYDSNLDYNEGIYTDASQAFRRNTFSLPGATFINDMGPEQYRDNEYFGAHVEINYETDLGTLTVIPAWRQAELDYLSPAGAFPYLQKETDEQFSFEVRLSGSAGIYDYILGAYYFDESVEIDTALNISSIASFLDNEYTTESFAPFARITANITEDFRIVGAVRYSTDKKASKGVTTGGTIFCTNLTMDPAAPCIGAPLFEFAESPEELAMLPAEGAGPNFYTGASPIPMLPDWNIAVSRSDLYLNESLKNERATFRLAAEYDIAEDSLLYASVETGYRSGGFNPATGFETFDPEYLTAYTIGSKNRLLDQRLQLNVEAFYWEYTDQQVSHVATDMDGRTANITENIGESEIMGIELESRFLLTENTLLSANIHYLHAESTDFVYQEPFQGTPPVTGCDSEQAGPVWVVDCSGFDSYNSPEWTINLGIQQTFPIDDDLSLILGLDTQYKSERYLAFQYLDEQYVDSVWRTNAQATLESFGGGWSVSAYIRNIEDERTPNYLNSSPSTNLMITGTSLPRNWGVRFAYSF